VQASARQATRSAQDGAVRALTITVPALVVATVGLLVACGRDVFRFCRSGERIDDD